MFLQGPDKISTTDMIDQFIYAELPSEENKLVAHEVVRTHMIHGPYGQLNHSSPCMQNGQC